MAITLTDRFAAGVDERFVKESLSTPGINQNYSWEGAKTIKVTSVPTVPLGDYTRQGTTRFGTPTELQNEVQEMTLRQDKAFSFTLDKMNAEETQMKAAEALGRQVREVIVPYVDQYRFTQMALKADGSAEAVLDEKTVYKAVTTGTEYLDEHEIPDGRVIFVVPALINLLKNSDGYVKASDLAQDRIVWKGMVAELDGMPVVSVPKKRMPDKLNFMIAHPSATVAPIKLADYRLHEDPPGISGTLAEGRIYFDAFVLNQKKNGIYVHKTPSTP
ncbi:hypothetical protein [Brevibacillus laterosporus]|uniref:hypothetical protein n=1 Tax=Brevibacillus laterosporus TaxID=1465 RepID=UPI0018F885B0|nr:hypothetical protein [Brevibacillus laterosporus]MBG9772413.1 hypothetical protein [Brevibacillus laterosporus]